ncbi:MAG: hypothetical protein LQ337_008863 [Flavoplaca oasis]|nr:MAG: hypothetical protein LQ337_008863 [Flavoplaca oasis]
MKFTIATSVALLLPFVIAQSSDSAGANTDAVSGQQYQPGAEADGVDGATSDASTAYGGLEGAGANNATSNSTAALGDEPGAGSGSASFDPSATSEDSSTPDADATEEYPSASSGAMPPAEPASEGASGSGSGGSMDYMKTAQDVPAGGSPSGGSMGGGMDQATSGDDNKQLVVSDRRFEENGNRRIELKIEFGESHVYQTWEIRDGKLEEVPGGTGGTAMPLSEGGASAASGSTSDNTMSKSQSPGASGSTQDSASSMSGFDDLTGGSPSPSGAPGSGSVSTTNGDTTQVDYPATNSTSSDFASLGGNQTDMATGTGPGASDDNSSEGSTAKSETSSDGASSAAGGLPGNTASDMMGKPDTAAAGGYEGNQQAKPGAATGSSGSKLRLRRSNGKNRRAI